ncbi:MAG: Uma2 family endonuclease [Rubrobacter sp.]|nr:Uma2 family endonuclease [Rubrobacter sp.]
MLPAQTKRRRFDVHQYHRMLEAGILSEDDRVELIDGEIVEMAAVGGRHIRTVNRLNMLLSPLAVGPGLLVSVQNPLRLDDQTEPEPDLALIRETSGEEVPRAGDAHLVVEVAETSLSWDRNVKVPRYARAGIPEVWLVDLASGSLEVYADPEPADRYATVRTLGGEEEMACDALGELGARVRDIL